MLRLCVQRIRRWVVLSFAAAAMANAAAQDQAPLPVPGPPAQPVLAEPLPQDQLDALLAPIALYPDQLLAQVLMAATYPLEVVQAARWIQQNPSVQGAALDQALQDKNWDPSVLSLAAFPQVLAMMNDKLEWTQQLGDAFLANQAQVMDTVQNLRARAQEAGNLRSTPQQTVVQEQQTIYIEPAQPQVVYVPVYDPVVVYGPWWVPAYRPWYWYPPPIYGYPPRPVGAAVSVGVVWGVGWAITANDWGWATPAWRRGGSSIHVTIIDNNRYLNRPQYRDRWRDGRWDHVPEHRKGVAYRDPIARDRYVGTNNAAIQAREPYRGRDLPRPAPAVDHPGPEPQARPMQPGQQPNARPRPQTQQPDARPMPQTQQPDARPMPQMQQPDARPMPQTQQPDARPMPPTQQPDTRPRPQTQQPNARPMPQTQQPDARPMPQAQQPSPRPLPQSEQPASRPMPQPQQPAASPMPQQPIRRPMPQPEPAVQHPAPPSALSPQSRGEVQRDSSRGQASRESMHGRPQGAQR